MSQFKNEFNQVIHNDDNMITGYRLGKRVQSEGRIGKNQKVDFGKEISTLIKHNSENEKLKAVAITADIISLVNGIQENSLHINYRFSTEGEYLTTGIITSHRVCKEFSHCVSKIIEAIQKSISFLYSSEKVVIDICEKLKDKKDLFDTSSLLIKHVPEIIKLMNEEKFYPADLNVSSKAWNEAVRSLRLSEQWDLDDENNSERYKNIINNSYEQYVYNDLVINAERSLAAQFGINLDTFKSEINSLLSPLQNEVKEIKDEIEKIKREKMNWRMSKKVYILG